MEVELSYEAEEYIETIYRLQKRNGLAKTKDLAETLHVVPGSITNTIEHLEGHGLITHEPYRGVKLTRQGERIALDILRRHRLAERLLTDMLNAGWSSVHEDACKLEHALTKSVAALLEEKLGYPKVCPHGNPIPTESGLIEEHQCTALIEANQSENYIVDRIIDGERESLLILEEKRIKPGAIIQVIKQDTEQVCLRIEGNEQQLSRDIAISVMVRKKREARNAVKA